MENNQLTAYEKAAKELGDKLVALYKLKMFPRDGKASAGYYTASESYDLNSYIIKVKESLKALLKNVQDAEKIRRARPYAYSSGKITYTDGSEGLDDPV